MQVWLSPVSKSMDISQFLEGKNGSYSLLS